MSELPLGWKRSNLEVLASASGGSTPSKAEPRFWNGGNVPWVSPKDMKTFVISDSEDHITEGALERLTLVPEDSVLVVVRSGILSRTLPVAITTAPVTINQDMRAFIPAQGVSATFLAWQLIANEYEILDACSKDGTTVASIEGVALAQFPIWIAPRAEQTRIVEKLEDLLGSLDAAVAELKAAQRKLAQYRQSLLKAAVEGTLTAQWRATHGTPPETGHQLLQRILQERRTRWEDKQRAKFAQAGKTPPKGWQAKYPEPAAPETSDLPALPEGWVWASLDQLAEFVTSGSRGWAEYYSTVGAMFIRSQDINKDRLDITDAAFVNPPANSEGARTRVQRNDLLLTITGANVGKTARVEVDLDEAYVSQHVALIRLVDQDISAYLHLFLICKAGGRGQLDKMAYGAGKPGLNLQQVLSVAVPVPSLEEMSQLLATLNTQLSAAKEQDAALARALRQAAAQRRNLLKAAFAGQLVPQDPADEPASELLARIRASKADNAGRTRAARNAK